MQLFKRPADDLRGCVAFATLELYRDIIGAVNGDYSLLEKDALKQDFPYQEIFSQAQVAGRGYEFDCTIDLHIGDDSLSARKQKHAALINGTRYANAGPGYPNAWRAILSNHELRRLIYSARWHRMDPVTQLPPGSTLELTHTVTAGLSTERSQKLSRSLGVTVGGDTKVLQAHLSSKLQDEFGFTFSVTNEEQRSIKLTLTNTSDSRYRLIALWRLDHKITIDTVIDESLSPKVAGVSVPRWSRKNEVEFVATNEPVVTFANTSQP